MTVTMDSAVFMGRNYLNNCQSIANTTDLTLEQMFDRSTRLVSSCSVFIGVSCLVSLFTSLSELSHPVHEHMT